MYVAFFGLAQLSNHRVFGNSPVCVSRDCTVSETCPETWSGKKLRASMAVLAPQASKIAEESMAGRETTLNAECH